MKAVFALLAGISIITLCSIGASEKPKVPENSWVYDLYHCPADSSAWVNGNKVEIAFYPLDSMRKRKDKSIRLSFSRWPVRAGDYRIVADAPTDTDAVMVHTGDKQNWNMSKMSNTGKVHVTIKNGKLQAWANNVMMEIRPWSLKSRTGYGDSTLLSFNLTER